jgi:hypothetical protein
MLNFVMLMNHAICLNLVMLLDNEMFVAAIIIDAVGLLPCNDCCYHVMFLIPFFTC